MTNTTPAAADPNVLVHANLFGEPKTVGPIPFGYEVLPAGSHRADDNDMFWSDTNKAWVAVHYPPNTDLSSDRVWIRMNPEKLVPRHFRLLPRDSTTCVIKGDKCWSSHLGAWRPAQTAELGKVIGSTSGIWARSLVDDVDMPDGHYRLSTGTKLQAGDKKWAPVTDSWRPIRDFEIGQRAASTAIWARHVTTATDAPKPTPATTTTRWVRPPEGYETIMSRCPTAPGFIMYKHGAWQPLPNTQLYVDPEASGPCAKPSYPTTKFDGYVDLRPGQTPTKADIWWSDHDRAWRVAETHMPMRNISKHWRRPIDVSAVPTPPAGHTLLTTVDRIKHGDKRWCTLTGEWVSSIPVDRGLLVRSDECWVRPAAHQDLHPVLLEGHDKVLDGELIHIGDRIWLPVEARWGTVEPDSPLVGAAVDSEAYIVVRPPPGVPEGYVQLAKGTRLQPGDKYWSNLAKAWVEGRSDDAHVNVLTWIRPIAPATPAATPAATTPPATTVLPKVAQAVPIPTIPVGYVRLINGTTIQAGDRYYGINTQEWLPSMAYAGGPVTEDKIWIRPFLAKYANAAPAAPVSAGDHDAGFPKEAPDATPAPAPDPQASPALFTAPTYHHFPGMGTLATLPLNGGEFVNLGLWLQAPNTCHNRKLGRTVALGRATTVRPPLPNRKKAPTSLANVRREDVHMLLLGLRSIQTLLPADEAVDVLKNAVLGFIAGHHIQRGLFGLWAARFRMTRMSTGSTPKHRRHLRVVN